jgi:hypothetical protein
MHARFPRVKRLVLILCVIALAALVGAIRPSRASAHVIITYAQGYYGAGGTFHTTGFGPRDFNRVYHQSGTTWWLFYCQTDGSCDNPYVGSVNPLVDNRDNGYAAAYCSNINDNSGVQWTCQTTKPS